ncbi:hypothetical protein DICA3_F23090 [Diutina catenulata]
MKLSIITALTTLVTAQPIADPQPVAKRWPDKFGNATWADDPEGACGRNHNSYTEDYVAISETLWKEINASGPEQNWMCDHYLFVYHGTNRVRVKIDDYCVDCDHDSLELSKHAFDQIADGQDSEIKVVWWFDDSDT